MKVKTLRFGELEAKDEDVIVFPKGPLGFEGYKSWILVDNGLLGWLQSAEDESLAFVVGNPFEFYGDYQFEISAKEMTELGIRSKEEVNVLSIVSVPPNVEEMTINLLAPIVVNSKTKQAKQVILSNNDYTVRHFVYADLLTSMKKKEVASA
ncbi:MAG: flagellar assembly protein FliW [Candidatus Margulisbacteria bacterium]|nr:flagellar assembly protein FliW [Candidatus Margulisiibacteriota bacterium]